MHYLLYLAHLIDDLSDVNFLFLRYRADFIVERREHFLLRKSCDFLSLLFGGLHVLNLQAGKIFTYKKHF